MGVAELELLKVAEQVAAETAELVRSVRASMTDGQDVEVRTKTSETDVVTAADQQAERLVRARLAELRPDEPVLGEEQGGVEGSGIRWVIDPIDGTVNFLYGFPWYAVSLAAQVDGVSVAGAVIEPDSGRRWTAARGHGAWLDGRRLRVGQPSKLAHALVITGFSYLPERRARQAEMVTGLLGRVRDIRRSGSASLDLCAVAAGWADGYVEHGLHRWDWAAGALVAAEAGAVVNLPEEHPELGGDATIAAAPSIHSELYQAALDCGIDKV
ncbi:myo-inositol-1(or 4)-monophosphatase [Tamaricihabitans halophyticus]|uniref:Inositol-1-monophosphatase n=1 Tax=Tamaricihabitans halophyticus TaxID=1262583 RepID=A0A4V2SUN7_9PSEU|nr:inositol monophosphatase family protein [Tamaricihabitans halophyticus]TCP55216.1 myo-inositol-1(or 4)-monophosphatase [Tamaricihabitans halophyticus]